MISVSHSLVNTIGMKLVRIDPGELLMGSPQCEKDRDNNETQHTVKLTEGLYVGVTQVTRGQFSAFAQATGYRTDAEKEGWTYVLEGRTFIRIKGVSWRNPGFDQDAYHPVVCVSWNDARAFCAWLVGQESRHYRLPTEAEWEYACRARTQTTYPWGDSPESGRGWANLADLTAQSKFRKWTGVFNWSDGFIFTAPVSSFRANPFGLYDMIGNVWEWCEDWYGEYPTGAVSDPSGPDTGTYRVLRGGSWGAIPRFCRSAIRDWYLPDYRFYYVGFRVVRD